MPVPRSAPAEYRLWRIYRMRRLEQRPPVPQVRCRRTFQTYSWPLASYHRSMGFSIRADDLPGNARPQLQINGEVCDRLPRGNLNEPRCISLDVIKSLSQKNTLLVSFLRH